MSETTACIDCLRRAWLLAALGPYVESWSTATEGEENTVDLLQLGDQELTRTVAPKVAEQVLARIQALPERKLLEELQRAECWPVAGTRRPTPSR